MNKLCTIFITIVIIMCQHINSFSASKNETKNETHERNKRFVFLRGSGIGVSWKRCTFNSIYFMNKKKCFFNFSTWLHWWYQRALWIGSVFIWLSISRPITGWPIPIHSYPNLKHRYILLKFILLLWLLEGNVFVFFK